MQNFQSEYLYCSYFSETKYGLRTHDYREHNKIKFPKSLKGKQERYSRLILKSSLQTENKLRVDRMTDVLLNNVFNRNH